MDRGEVGAWFGFVLFIAVFTGYLMYSTAHDRGYVAGHNDSQLYFEATNGEFPSEHWIIGEREHKHETTEDILDTLRPYRD